MEGKTSQFRLTALCCDGFRPKTRIPWLRNAREISAPGNGFALFALRRQYPGPWYWFKLISSVVDRFALHGYSLSFRRSKQRGSRNSLAEISAEYHTVQAVPSPFLYATERSHSSVKQSVLNDKGNFRRQSPQRYAISRQQRHSVAEGGGVC